VAYRTAPVDSSGESLDARIDPVAHKSLAVVLRDESDAITFFSPSAFDYFARIFGDCVLREIGGRLTFAAVGPVTASKIRDAGFEVAVEAREATSESLAAALGRYFLLQGHRNKEMEPRKKTSDDVSY
jgi:uroporphyrinogen-III synthase